MTIISSIANIKDYGLNKNCKWNSNSRKSLKIWEVTPAIDLMPYVNNNFNNIESIRN